MKITISKTDKFAFPGRYDTSGTGLSVEFELDEQLPLDQRLAKLQEFKAQFDQLYWPLASHDFQTYLHRLQVGNENFLHWQMNNQS